MGGLHLQNLTMTQQVVPSTAIFHGSATTGHTYCTGYSQVSSKGKDRERRLALRRQQKLEAMIAEKKAEM